MNEERNHAASEDGMESPSLTCEICATEVETKDAAVYLAFRGNNTAMLWEKEKIKRMSSP